MHWSCLNVTKFKSIGIVSCLAFLLLVIINQYLFSVSYRINNNLTYLGVFKTTTMSTASSATSAFTKVLAEDYIPYTFDDPAQYSGPILAGWPPEKSRNVSLYIKPGKDTILSDMSCMDFIGVRLFVVVQSAPIMFGRRQLIRDTYMQFTKNLTDIKLVFLFGISADQNTTKLKEEQSTFCDFIQADFVDSYENVTMDTLMILKLALSISWKPEDPKFLVIADDDTYLNLQGIHEELFFKESGVLKEDDKKLWGYELLPKIHYPTNIIGNRTIIPRDPFPYSPSYMYNQKFYPLFLTGGGYVVPFKTVPCLYEKSLALPLYHINDVFLTGFVRQECGLKLEFDQRFLPNRMNFEILTYNVLMYHQGTEKGRRILDHVVRKQKGRIDECRGNSFCIRDKVLLWCKSSDQDCEMVKLARNQL